MSKTKPSKKPTTKVGRECVRGMKQLRDALALTKPIHDRALAAAVRKERVRCAKVVTDVAKYDGECRAQILYRIRSGT